MKIRMIVPALAVLALPLSACGGEDETIGPAAAPSATAQAPESALDITDPWVKTVDKGMTAAFGTITNTTDADVTIVSATTPAAPEIELHEVVGAGGEMKMQAKQGGFVVPAGGELELEPGGYHIMLMGVTEPIEPGQEVAFTLTLADQSTFEFSALAKEFNGGNESYAPGH
ncbi:copper chaperone PCu(A)C [Actinomadura sp. WMMB 499]|uniref:copper chaperone PCu(A)C n=1 Tax=Actinomadura sp. WMMB 499 TaxID=1219491 RepID=UPI0012456905|nr:copper chaperone PCu(A)C [Actinomadura sp. WMMB 499]QFG20225.1 copper chaperone PCu(A)C [Actinomadura sp. WMMB 499]